MDYSSGAQQPQQPQQQQYYSSSQAYDPSQSQAYDPSQSQAYDPSSSYYDPSIAYYQHQHHHYDQYYPHHYYAGPTDSSHTPQHQQQGGGALNPAAAAAVVALSQLSQFAGSMDAAERAAAMAEIQLKGNGDPPPPPPPGTELYLQHPSGGRGRSLSRGGGRRGGGSFRGRGGGRGNFNHDPTGQHGGAPPALRDRGRGRGRGRGRMGRGGGMATYQSTPDSQSIHSTSVIVGEHSPAPESAQLASTQAPPALAAKGPVRPIALAARCDICGADCNSLEILEQHKNGKRHKKNVQRAEEIQKQQRLLNELHAKVMPENNDSPAVGITPNAAGLSAQLGEMINVSIAQNKATAAPENVQTANLTVQQNLEIEEQKGHTAEGLLEAAKVQAVTEASSFNAPLSSGPTEGSTDGPRFGRSEHFDRRRGSMKRKMTRPGRGGKRLKSSERDRVPERLREQPRVCTLCNAMCDTQAVFEVHLSGKKHLSKLRRFQGQDTVYGPITVYIPPNQPSANPTKGPEPLFYGLKSHEMLQLEAFGALNGLQVENYGIHHGYQSEQNRGPENGSQEPEVVKGLDHPKNEEVDTAKGDQEGVTMDNTESQANNALDFEVKDSSVAPVALAFATANSEVEVHCTVEEDVIPVLEYGSLLGADVVLPGLSAEVGEPGANAEELTNGDEMPST